MKISEIRALETKELLAKVEEFKKELFELRFKQATGQLENTARVREVRKSIAKIKTVIRERELAE
jgi:large subunit ribosomal protein L29